MTVSGSQPGFDRIPARDADRDSSLELEFQRVEECTGITVDRVDYKNIAIYTQMCLFRPCDVMQKESDC